MFRCLAVITLLIALSAPAAAQMIPLLAPNRSQFVIGPVTGNRYVPNGAGEIFVDPLDVAGLTPLGYKFVSDVICGASAIVAHTGDTAEFALAICPVAAGALGLNGRLRLTYWGQFTGSTNAKTYRARFGASAAGLTGTAVATVATSTTANVGIYEITTIANRAAANSQTITSGGAPGLLTAASATAAIDTTVTTYLSITGQLANSGETVQLDGYMVEILHK